MQADSHTTHWRLQTVGTSLTHSADLSYKGRCGVTFPTNREQRQEVLSSRVVCRPKGLCLCCALEACSFSGQQASRGFMRSLTDYEPTVLVCLLPLSGSAC